MTPAERKAVWERVGCKKTETVRLFWRDIESAPEEVQDQFLGSLDKIMDLVEHRGVRPYWW